MQIEEHNDSAFNYIKEYIRNFEPNFSLYTVTKDDRIEVGRRIDDIVKSLTIHKDLFYARIKIKKLFKLKFIPNDETQAYRVYNVDFSQSVPVTLVTNAQ